jgi:hypothetical protein
VQRGEGELSHEWTVNKVHSKQSSAALVVSGSHMPRRITTETNDILQALSSLLQVYLASLLVLTSLRSIVQTYATLHCCK